MAPLAGSECEKNKNSENGENDFYFLTTVT